MLLAVTLIILAIWWATYVLFRATTPPRVALDPVRPAVDVPQESTRSGDDLADICAQWTALDDLQLSRLLGHSSP
jgi:hypothetical protein